MQTRPPQSHTHAQNETVPTTQQRANVRKQCSRMPDSGIDHAMRTHALAAKAFAGVYRAKKLVPNFEEESRVVRLMDNCLGMVQVLQRTQMVALGAAGGAPPARPPARPDRAIAACT